MPSSAEHQAKYIENREFLDANGGLATIQPVWASVVAFYAAVHLVERLAARQNIHHDNHGERKGYLIRHRLHRVIYPEYHALRTVSEIARYGTQNRFRLAVLGNDVQTILIDTHLVAIETYVLSVFAPPGGPTAAGS